MSLPCLLSADALPGGRLPSRGSLGPPFPTFVGTMRRYDCHLPSQGASLVARRPDTLPASLVRGLSAGFATWSKHPDHARAFGRPVPQSGSETRREVALPSSRVPPVKTCPALRPRWCPAHSPWRTQDCGLPVRANRRLPTTIPLSGLHHAACLLATPGFVRSLTGRHAGLLLTCWLDFSQVGLEPY